MKTLQRYILSQVLKNFVLALSGFTLLFLIFDFFDRIDNIIPEDASVVTIAQYFLYKVPLMLSLMFPVGMLVAVMLTIGILSKNSEITAMRASGLTVAWLTRPLLICGVVLSLTALLLNETLVPYCTRRVKEIYNIDIRQKHLTGGYSQSDFWWRAQEDFYSVGVFDSRTNTLHHLSWFELGKDFQIRKRIDASKATWLNEDLGWSMEGVTEYRFPRKEGAPIEVENFAKLALPIRDKPREFYDSKMEPQTMSFVQLRKFIRRQASNGVPISGYLSDLYEKISFPFITLVVIPVVLPFALKPARSGSMAASFIAGLIIAFSYYAVHSFSLALGRAEIWNPLLAAWMANIVMGLVGFVLFLGAESPN